MPVDAGTLAQERHHRILEEALAHNTVRIRDLATSLGVHEMTVRRDLEALAGQGFLERVHGGARLVTQASEEIAHSLRANQQTEAKIRIAQAALEFVLDGDSLALDASTTSLSLARLLPARRVSAVVTSLDAAETLASGDVPFTLVGGTFHPPARSFVGPLVTAALARLHPDKVFFSAHGFTPKAGFTDAHLPEAEVKERLIDSAGFVVALLDHTKFGRQALSSVVPLHRVDVLVTDRDPGADIRAVLDAADTRLVVAGEAARMPV